MKLLCVTLIISIIFPVTIPVVKKVALSAINKSSPARQTAGLLYLRTAGGDRTRYNSLSRRDALSNELQRYAIWNLD